MRAARGGTRVAFLSGRSPSYRGWRSRPFWVHSAKAISATSSGLDPVDGLAERRLAVVEGVGLPAQLVEPPAEVEQDLAGVAGADLARVAEPVALVIADEQGPEADARALRVGPAADDELLPADALDLHPGVAPARDVGAVEPLADDPLLGPPRRPAARPRCPVPGTESVRRIRSDQATASRSSSWRSRERQAGHVGAVEVEDVEEVEVGRVPLHPPADLAGVVEVEPLLERAEARLARPRRGRRPRRRRSPGGRRACRRPSAISGNRDLLRLVVAAEERQVAAVEAGEDAEAVELRLEGPVGAVEGRVDERAEHRGRRVRHRRGRQARVG